MKTRKWVLILMLAAFALSFRIPAKADVGPKPSVTVTFAGPAEEPYYAVLLSEVSEYGPWSAQYAQESGIGEDVLSFFLNFQDPDGYFFIGNAAEVKDSTYRWGYYPPQRFKILVYYPQSRSYVIGTIQERYAFDSYYRFDCSTSETVRNPQYGKNITGFAVRLAATVVLELLIGLLFGYRSKESRKTIIVTNLITQILLNAVMFALDYSSGMLVWLIFFPIAEIGVILIEAAVYALRLKEKSRGRAVLYALTANIVTALLGFYTGIAIG